MTQLNPIATPEFVQDHPELHHYTSIDGLKGIVESKTLWATHFEDLNDASEILHLRGPLTEALTTRFHSTLAQRQEGSRTPTMDSDGPAGIQAAAAGLATDLVTALYATTFKDRDDAGQALGAPFVASFCSHAGDLEYERCNGLLSQWRGYGGQGGVCIVFDTARLVEMLEIDQADANWVHIQIGPAEYHVGDQSITRLFPALLDSCEVIVTSMLAGANIDFPNSLFQEFVDAAARFKHRGFIEEREVRVIAVPLPPSTLELMKRQRPEFDSGSLKAIARRPAGNREARYVTLFEQAERPLPINRVIIGPSLHQTETEAIVRATLPSQAPIVRSATPFVGT